jgi:arabinogalactan oligomer/maltooligosaccharide transport system permease protein
MRRPSRGVLAFQYAVLVLASIFALYPIWFIFLASGRIGNRLYSLNLVGMFLPVEFSLENYQAMLLDPSTPFPLWLKNSLFVAGTTTIFCLLISTSAAFAFSRFRFRGRELGLILFLAIQAFPGVLALVPQAQILGALGLYRSHLGLILAYTSFTLVFCTWNLKGYFDTIPIDLEEAGMIDGCGPVQSFLLIALPLARPALAVTALFGFLAGWGEYALASVLIPAPDTMRTVPVGMYSLANDMSVPWGLFAAGALMLLVPIMLLFSFLQRFLEAGLTLGGVKG